VPQEQSAWTLNPARPRRDPRGRSAQGQGALDHAPRASHLGLSRRRAWNSSFAGRLLPLPSLNWSRQSLLIVHGLPFR